MLSGRLILDAESVEELDAIDTGTVEVEITELDAGVPGELVRRQARPLHIDGLCGVYQQDPTRQRAGPLLRVFVQRPDDQEEQ